MTQPRERHLSNTIWLVGAGAASKLLFFLATVILYKKLRLDESGAFGLAYALATTFVLFAELGLRGYVAREMSKLRVTDAAGAQELFTTSLYLRLLLAVLVVPAALIGVWAAGYDASLLLPFAALLLFAILDSFAILLKAVFRAYGRMELDAFTSVLSRLALLLLLLPALFRGIELEAVGPVFIAAALLECLTLMVFIHRVLPLRLCARIPDMATLRDVFLRSLPFAFLAAIGILYLRTGVFALSKIDTLRDWMPWSRDSVAGHSAPTAYESVAWFTAAARIPEALSFLPIAVINAFIPFFSRNAAQPEQIQKTFATLLHYLGLTGIVIAFALLAEPEFILTLIAKAEFFPAAPAVRILAATLPVTFISYIFANLLICLGEERLVMRRYLCIFALNVVLNCFFVPAWGATGAALALASSEAGALVFDSLALYRKRIRIPVQVIATLGGVLVPLTLTLAVTRELAPLVRIAVVATAGGLIFLGLAWLRDRDTWCAAIGRGGIRMGPAKSRKMPG